MNLQPRSTACGRLSATPTSCSRPGQGRWWTIFLAPCLGTLVGLGLQASAGAQCANPWVAQGGLPGVAGQVHAITTYDPDGSGPLPARLLVGGQFAVAGNVHASNLAAWDPATGAWSALGTGTNGTVRALTTLTDGSLVVAGDFTTAGGVAASHVARWNGSVWSPLGPGTDAPVHALASLPGGQLVAGGDFTLAGGMSASRIARWNGAAWSPLGSGVDGRVRALALLPGALVAGGEFLAAGGMATGCIARWDGAAWSGMGALGWAPSQTTQILPFVAALTTLSNFDLIVGGAFDTGTGPNQLINIGRWDGTAWSPLGGGIVGSLGSMAVHALVTLPNNQVIAAGDFFLASQVSTSHVARWDGTNWSPLGEGLNRPAFALGLLPNGDLIAGGRFWAAGGVGVQSTARWNGSTWSALGSGTNLGPAALAALPGGGFAAGGYFLTIGGIVAHRVARWTGAAWVPLGSGTNDEVAALCVLPNGDLVAGGYFTAAGGVAALRIARWNGTAWQPLGGGMNGPVFALAVLPNGDLIAGGSFSSAGGLSAGRIARWDGSAWSALGAGVVGDVFALAVLPNGDVVAGGAFSSAGGTPANCIARWDGTAWSPLGSGMASTNPLSPSVNALAVLPNGDVIAGGEFDLAGGVAARAVARWDGSAWWPLGAGLSSPWGTAHAVAVLPDGDVVVAGRFDMAGTVAANHIARWDGTAWSALGAGLGGNPDPMAQALTGLTNGDVIVGGSFFTADNQVSAGLARLTTSCPAMAAVTGPGCPGAGGANRYQPQRLPWTGSTWRGRASGLAPSALAAVVGGFTSVMQPLSSLLPAPAGCNALVSPDAVYFTVPQAGVVDTQLTIPDSPALVGVTVHQQLLVLELNTQSAFVQATATDRITLTVGSF